MLDQRRDEARGEAWGARPVAGEGRHPPLHGSFLGVQPRGQLRIVMSVQAKGAKPGLLGLRRAIDHRIGFSRGEGEAPDAQPRACRRTASVEVRTSRFASLPFRTRRTVATAAAAHKE